MSDDQARAYVMAMYPGKYWKVKVKRMRREQIVAIYLKALKDKDQKDKDRTDENEDSDWAQF